MTGTPNAVEINLSAAIVAVANNDPLILTTPSGDDNERDELPFGPFNPAVASNVRDRICVNGWRSRRLCGLDMSNSFIRSVIGGDTKLPKIGTCTSSQSVILRSRA